MPYKRVNAPNGLLQPCPKAESRAAFKCDLKLIISKSVDQALFLARWWWLFLRLI